MYIRIRVQLKDIVKALVQGVDINADFIKITI